MEAKNEEVVAHLLSDVVEFARRRLPEATFRIVEPFLRHYYDFVDADDLQSRSIADLYGAAMAHWQTAQKFVPGSERLRVYNPILEQHGWHSDHTVIEIVNDDMPFLVDSVTMAVNRLGLALHSALHPVFRIWRGRDGGIERVDAGGATPGDGQSQLASFIHFEVDRCGDAALLNTLRNDIAHVLGDVRASVEDWPKIVDIARATIKEMKARESTAEDIEARAFLEWMAADHFTFLGQRDYALVSDGTGFGLRGIEGTGFGILRESLRTSDAPDVTPLPPAAADIITGAWPIFLTKANSRATVHRPGYLDYIGVKLVGPDGKVAGERRFIGLYTSTAYFGSYADIPIVRRKCANIVRRAGFLPKGHLGKSLVTVLETYPRDELFQADEDQLYDIALGILRLQEHQRTRLFVRRDRFDRFVSCLVFVPRDKYNTDLRRRIAKLLIDAYNGVNVEFTPLLSESAIARIHFVVHAEPGTMPDVDTRELETRLVQVTRRWQDDLADALLDAFGEEQGNRLLQRYADSFPAGYRDDYPARTAVRDIELIERVKDSGQLAMNLYRPIEAEARVPLQGLSRGRPDRAVAQPADARASRRARRRGTAVPDPDAGRRACVGTRLRPRTRGRYRIRHRAREGPVRGCVRPDLERPDRERRLQPPRAARPSERTRSDDPARVCEVPAASRLDLQRRVYRARADRQPGDRAAARRAVPAAVRPGHRRHTRRAGRAAAEGDRRRARPGAEP